MVIITQPDFQSFEPDISSASLSGTGYAGTLPHEPTDDVVARLRAVVAEVTRKPCDAPVRPHFGFMP